MPNISDILDKNKDKSKFTKKEYRPWNLGETMSSQVEVKDKKVDSPKKADLVDKNISESNNRLSVKEAKIAPSKAVVKPEVTPIKEVTISLDEGETNLSFDDHILRLSGHQKELLIFIIRNLVNSKSLITLPIFSKDLVENFSTTLGTIKNAARRLEAKGLIKSVSQRARGGYFRFELTEEVVNIGQRLLFKI
jgi:hypothetical protein